MNRIVLFLAVLSLTFSSIGYSQNKPVTLKPYPVTKKIDKVDNYNGIEISDPYQWLENIKSSETASWIKEQNDLALNYLDQIPYRNEIKNTLKKINDRIKIGLPEKGGNNLFYLYNPGNLDNDVLMMLEGNSYQGIKIIDPNQLFPKGNAAITDFKISRNGKFIAFSISENGSEWNKIYIYDINKKKVLDEVLQGVKYSKIAWKDNGFYYSRYEFYYPEVKSYQSNLTQNIFYHQIGTSQKQDQKILEDFQYRNYTAFVDDEEKYLIIKSTEFSSSGNGLFINKSNAGSETTELIAITDYSWEFIGMLNDSLLVKTNFKAPNYQLVLIDPSKMLPDSSQIRILLPENPEFILKEATLASDDILVTYTQFGRSFLKTVNYNGEITNDVRLEVSGNFNQIAGWKKFPTAFIALNGYWQPDEIVRYDLKTGKNSPMSEVKNYFDQNNYIIETCGFQSFDLAKIPMMVIYKKGMIKNGSNPLLLTNNEGFNSSMVPVFNPNFMLFINNGGIVAYPFIRGGNDFTKEWNSDGIKENRQIAVNDFIAAAQYLIDRSYTRSGLIAIQGSGDGGLLVGACLCQRPDLFKVAIAQNGIFDLLRYHLYTDNTVWRTQYGASDNRNNINYLSKFSPLLNIKAGVVYPSTLLTTSIFEDEIYPAHSFKFIATLQEKNKGSNPMLIRIHSNDNEESGKTSKRFIDENADILSFLYYNLGMNFKSELSENESSMVKDKKNPKKPAYVNDPIFKKNMPQKSSSEPLKPGNQEQQLPKK